MDKLKDLNIVQEPESLAKIKNYDGQLSIELSNKALSYISLEPYFKFQNISYIFLSDNKISALDDRIFQQFPLLTWLDLRNNELTSFPSTVENHQHLNTILLSFNRLKRLPLELGTLPKLTGLDVRGNPLEYPHQDVINKGPKVLIDFLRFEWKSLLHTDTAKDENEQSNEPTEISRNGSEENQKLKRSSSMVEIDTALGQDGRIVNISLVEHMWHMKLIELLQIQEKQLQKQRDKEALRQWKDKYRKPNMLLDARKTISKPPFAVYNQFQRILSRKDLLKSINENQEVRVPSKVFDDIDGEMTQLSKMLETLFQHDKQDMDPTKEMANRLEEINKLKGILKTISSLKMRN